MSFYTDASLVLIPSGYKDQKVYSAKPVDGSGDLTFSRASSATRVNSSGLVEKVRTNLATYSNDVSNAAWTKLTDGTYTITSETITDPFGNSVAVQKVTLTSGGYLVLRNLLGSATTSPTTGSVYIKKTVSTTSVDTDLSDTGVATSANNTDWQRLVSTNPASVYGSGTFLDINITTVNEPVYVAYAQIELSDFGATDYIATTSAAVSVGPVSGLPRLDYSGGATCPSLLLEPQRTNLAIYSNFNASYWTQTDASISLNSATSPDGYQNAHTATRTSSSNKRVGTAVFSGVAGQPFTTSIYLRKVSGSGIVSYADINNSATNITLTNEWQRYSVTATASATALRLYIDMSQDGDVIEFWEGQIEQGAYSTSLIPTLSTAVTRVADAASKTGISSLIGQTEGTLFVDLTISKLSITGANLYLTDGTNEIGIQMPPAAPNNFRAIVYNGGAFPVLMDVPFSTTGRYKIAFAYKANDFVIYVNGTLGGSDTSGAVPACSQFGIIGDFNDGINQTLLFPTRLSNADLATLTTL